MAGSGAGGQWGWGVRRAVARGCPRLGTGHMGMLAPGGVGALEELRRSGGLHLTAPG